MIVDKDQYMQLEVVALTARYLVTCTEGLDKLRYALDELDKTGYIPGGDNGSDY